jgi:hypothetical protein
MGIDIDGVLLIGGEVCYLRIPEEFEEDVQDYVNHLYDEYELRTVSPYYDCDLSEQMIGFKLTQGDKTLDDFFVEIKNKSEKFKEITGIEPKLMGLANVW